MDIICWAFCSCRDRSTAGCQQRSPEGPSLGTIGSIAPLPYLDRPFRAHRWGSWALISKAQELKIRTLTAFMVNCCSRVAKRAMRAQKKKRGQSKLFFKIPRTLDWDGSATFERTPGQVLYRVKGKNSHVWIHGNQNALNHITFKLALDSHCVMIFWELFAVINCGMPQAPWTRSAISRLSSADASTKWQKGWTQQLYVPHPMIDQHDNWL